VCGGDEGKEKSIGELNGEKGLAVVVFISFQRQPPITDPSSTLNPIITSHSSIAYVSYTILGPSFSYLCAQSLSLRRARREGRREDPMVSTRVCLPRERENKKTDTNLNIGYNIILTVSFPFPFVSLTIIPFPIVAGDSGKGRKRERE